MGKANALERAMQCFNDRGDDITVMSLPTVHMHEGCTNMHSHSPTCANSCSKQIARRPSIVIKDR